MTNSTLINAHLNRLSCYQPGLDAIDKNAVRMILFFIYFLFVPTVFAHGSLVKISPNENIYSEYYANSSAPFKGTIVFINGSGSDMSVWKNKKFFDCVKKVSSIFLYDRPGLGKSPANLSISSQHPITTNYISDQLTLLLKKLAIPLPYIFVTHSYGAMYAGYYTLKNPKNVKALVLVDPVPRDFNFSSKRMAQYQNIIEEARSKSAKYINEKYSGSKAEVIYQMLGFNDSKRELKKLGMINADIPIIIISSTGMELQQPLNEDWYISQKQWLNQNPDSKIYKVKSSHFVQRDQPDLVCSVISKFLDEYSAFGVT